VALIVTVGLGSFNKFHISFLFFLPCLYTHSSFVFQLSGACTSFGSKEVHAGNFPLTNRKCRKTSKVHDNDEDEDVEGDSDADDEDDGWRPGACAAEEAESGDEAIDSVDFDAADVLSKLLALVNQVSAGFVFQYLSLIFSQIRSSPQAKAYFIKQCEKEKITPLQLIKCFWTCWGSMADLLEWALYGQVISIFPPLSFHAHCSSSLEGTQQCYQPC
jgi:hypothetical protein